MASVLRGVRNLVFNRPLEILGGPKRPRRIGVASHEHRWWRITSPDLGQDVEVGWDVDDPSVIEALEPLIHPGAMVMPSRDDIVASMERAPSTKNQHRSPSHLFMANPWLDIALICMRHDHPRMLTACLRHITPRYRSDRAIWHYAITAISERCMEVWCSGPRTDDIVACMTESGMSIIMDRDIPSLKRWIRMGGDMTDGSMLFYGASSMCEARDLAMMQAWCASGWPHVIPAFGAHIVILCVSKRWADGFRAWYEGGGTPPEHASLTSAFSECPCDDALMYMIRCAASHGWIPHGLGAYPMQDWQRLDPADPSPVIRMVRSAHQIIHGGVDDPVPPIDISTPHLQACANAIITDIDDPIRMARWIHLMNHIDLT
jgi:hypothetical protein